MRKVLALLLALVVLSVSVAPAFAQTNYTMPAVDVGWNDVSDAATQLLSITLIVQAFGVMFATSLIFVLIRIFKRARPR